MQQEKKFTKNHKYNYLKAIICEQSDKVYRKCYTCQQWKPLDTENYLRNEREVMWFTFQCKECRNEYKKQRRKFNKEQIQNQLTDEKSQWVCLKNAEQKELFDWKIFTRENVEEKTETLEDKVNKILSFLKIK